jgi:hypothetical protein
MDISYYPSNFPILKIQDKVTGPLVARVIYSRPGKNDRKIFGDLLEYGRIWRMGANEATEIEFFQEVSINKVKIKKGRYTLYAIPYENKWTIIVNKETDTWGSFRYDEKKDIVRMDVATEVQSETAEILSMYFDKTETGIALLACWDTIKISIPIELSSIK